MANAQHGLLKFVKDTMDAGVVKTFLDASTMVNILPMKPNQGSMTYIYNSVDSMLNAEVRDLGEDVEGQTVAPVQHVEMMKIFSNEVLIDRLYVEGGLGNLVDIKTENTINATTGLVNEFARQVYYGDGTTKQLKGLEARVAEGQGVKFTTFNLDTVDEMIDEINYSNNGVKCLLMNAKTRRALTKLVKEAGYCLGSLELAGRQLEIYNNTAIVVDAQVKDGEVFAVNFSEIDGVHGVTLNGVHHYEEELRGSTVAMGIDFTTGLVVKHPKAVAHLKVAGRSK